MAIRARELSAQEVVEAHIERLASDGARINAVVADRFAQARSEARAADERVAAAAGASDQALPPLLGVPFTVKESIALAGMPQSAGLLARREYRSSVSAPAVQQLIDAGAIPLGVTNTSELTLWIEFFRQPRVWAHFDSIRRAPNCRRILGRRGGRRRVGRLAVWRRV